MREVAGFVDEPIDTSAAAVSPSVERLFGDLQPFMADIGRLGDPPDAIHTRVEGE